MPTKTKLKVVEPPAAGHNSDVQITAEDLIAILNELHDSKRAVSEASGRHRQKLKEILEDQQWNKAALGAILQIDAKSETDRADYLRTFAALFDVMMTERWASEIRDLVTEMESEGGEPEGDGGE